MFVAVVRTEFLKLRRTLALRMVLVAPVVVLALQFLVMHQRHELLARGGRDLWPQLTRSLDSLWAILMLPLFITLETALISGLEHVEKQWKSLMALPLPHWVHYYSKLVVALVLVVAATSVLGLGTVLVALLLRVTRPDLNFSGSVPWAAIFLPLGRSLLAVSLGMVIQHSVSLRWQSFTVAVSVGMCAVVTTAVVVNSATWSRVHPWALTVHAIAPDGLRLALGAAAVAIVAAGVCGWEFSRREIV